MDLSVRTTNESFANSISKLSIAAGCQEEEEAIEYDKQLPKIPANFRKTREVGGRQLTATIMAEGSFSTEVAEHEQHNDDMDGEESETTSESCEVESNVHYNINNYGVMVLGESCNDVSESNVDFTSDFINTPYYSPSETCFDAQTKRGFPWNRDPPLSKLRNRVTKITDYFPQRKRRKNKPKKINKQQKIICNIINKRRGLVNVGDYATINYPSKIDQTKWLDIFNRIANDVYPVRDSASWDAFYKKVDTGIECAKQSRLGEIEVFLLIEKSIGLSYQNRNDEAKKLSETAKNMILSRPDLKMKEFLVAMLFTLIASLHRRDNEVKKAENDVFIARRNLEYVQSDHSHLAWALLNYEEANVMFMQDGEQYTQRATKLFQDSIKRCELMRDEDRNIYIQRDQFCKLKLVLILLKSNTAAARREQTVDETNIKEALACIDSVRKEMISGGSLQMLLRCVDSVYYIRTGNHVVAKRFLREALDEAERIGFHVQTADLQERFQEI